MPTFESSNALRTLLVQWWCWCVWMFLLVVLHPLGTPVPTLAFAELTWIAMECVLLQSIPLLIAVIWFIKRPEVASKYGRSLFASVPLWFAVDVLAYRGSGLHFASSEFFELIRDHFPRLISFVSWGMLTPLLSIATYIAVGILLSKLLARLVSGRRPARGVLTVVFCITVFILAIGSLRWLLREHNQRRTALHANPTRHPLNALVGHDNSRVLAIGPEQADSANEPTKPFTYDPQRFAERISTRLRQMRLKVVMEPPAATGSAKSPDILIIICESLRSEMLDPDVMPNAFQAARSGWWLREHYSGGNATSLGMFSLMSGLESIWFYRSESRFAPAMNRLFRQAGYELGFFAGHDDWGAFQMDAFLSPRQFDRYEVEPMNWLASDRRSIAKTMQFLRRPPAPETRPPRLAVLFLYSTHAPFAVEDDLATDQPAASGDYPIPFPDSWRERVWNRYRNAARTLDAELSDLLRSDAAIALIGDHGESFLDDATIGHGTKLSRAQTRTAALISGPMFSAREVHERTMHVDFLPTLLAAAGRQVSRPAQLDGIDLATATHDQLSSRVFSISNLVGRDLVVVAPEDRHPGKGFGTRVEFSLMDGTVAPQGRIDGRGDLIGPPDRKLLQRWLTWIERTGKASERPSEN